MAFWGGRGDSVSKFHGKNKNILKALYAIKKCFYRQKIIIPLRYEAEIVLVKLVPVYLNFNQHINTYEKWVSTPKLRM